MHRIIAIASFFALNVTAHALDISGLTNKDTINGLKEALSQSSSAAVAKLGVENGFLGNERVKIPLPDNLQKIEGMMRTFGMGSYADELIDRKSVV